MNSVAHLQPIVRQAGPRDEQEVIRLLLLSHAENGVQPASNAKVLWYVKRYIWPQYIPEDDTGPRGVFGVIGQSGCLEAMIMLTIGCYWYSEAKHLEEYLVFVDPNFRHGDVRHGIVLLDWAKLYADRLRLKLMTGIISNNRTEAKCRLYRRKMTKIGEFFLYNGSDTPDFNSDLLTGKPQPRLVLSSSSAMVTA